MKRKGNQTLLSFFKVTRGSSSTEPDKGKKESEKSAVASEQPPKKLKVEKVEKEEKVAIPPPKIIKSNDNDDEVDRIEDSSEEEEEKERFVVHRKAKEEVKKDVQVPPPQSQQEEKSTKDNYQWYWKSDANKWIPYNKAISDRIEEAFSKKEKKCNVDSQRYIDFNFFLQFRFDDTSKKRIVKREKASDVQDSAPPCEPGEPKWFWLGDNGVWNAFDDEVSKRLERAHRMKLPTCKVDEERFVNFKEMTQMRYDDNTKRRVVKRDTKPQSSPPQQIAHKPVVNIQSTVKHQASQQPVAQKPIVVLQSQIKHLTTPKKDNATSGTWKWSWFNDKDWVDFPEETSQRIEKAYKLKLPTCKVDEERFIDFKIEAQVRYDDKTKKRAIKRSEVIVNQATKPVNQDEPQKKEQGTASSQATKWFFCVDEALSEWAEYPDEISARLNRAVALKLPKATINGTTVVHFASMLQITKEGGNEKKALVCRKEIPQGAILVSLNGNTKKHQEVGNDNDSGDETEPDERLQNMRLDDDSGDETESDDVLKRMGDDNDSGDETEPDERLQNMKLDDDSGDETESDDELKRMGDESDETEPDDDDDAEHFANKKDSLNMSASMSYLNSLGFGGYDDDDDDEDDEEEQEKAPRKRGVISFNRGITDWKTITSWGESKGNGNESTMILRKMYSVSPELNKKVALWQGDMTKLQIDAIVNAAKTSLLGGGGSKNNIYFIIFIFIFISCFFK